MLVVAHRGASAHLPEHTLAAYRLALEQGADGLECDVRLSRDGHLVCVHDRRVDRTSTGRGVVSTMTLAELAELSFGEPGVLTLDALLGLVRDAGRPVTLFVETKHPVRYAGRVEEALAAALVGSGVDTVMMSFSALAVRRFHRLAPDVPTVLLLDDRFGRHRDGALPDYATHAGPGIGSLRSDPGQVARWAEHGHATYCWTVDEPADVLLCRDLGVRFLATNAPGATRRVLAAR